MIPFPFLTFQVFQTKMRWLYILRQRSEAFEKHPLLLNLCVRLKFQSSKYCNVFLWLKFPSSLTLNKIERFSKASVDADEEFILF